MTMPDLPTEGSCRCGRVRIRITLAPMLTIACHCAGCQRMTASAFSLTVMVPQGGFAVIAGEPVPGGLHTDDAHHMHCGWCMSWTHSTFTPSRGIVNIRATMLDDISWFVPFAETMSAEKLPWVDLPVSRSYPGWPPMEDYAALLKDFAAT